MGPYVSVAGRTDTPHMAITLCSPSDPTIRSVTCESVTSLQGQTQPRAVDVPFSPGPTFASPAAPTKTKAISIISRIFQVRLHKAYSSCSGTKVLHCTGSGNKPTNRLMIRYTEPTYLWCPEIQYIFHPSNNRVERESSSTSNRLCAYPPYKQAKYLALCAIPQYIVPGMK